MQVNEEKKCKEELINLKNFLIQNKNIQTTIKLHRKLNANLNDNIQTYLGNWNQENCFITTPIRQIMYILLLSKFSCSSILPFCYAFYEIILNGSCCTNSRIGDYEATN
jgi:hypothetical protein